jgi:hypothetical protein
MTATSAATGVMTVASFAMVVATGVVIAAITSAVTGAAIIAATGLSSASNGSGGMPIRLA